jgi:hypothetical protein
MGRSNRRPPKSLLVEFSGDSEIYGGDSNSSGQRSIPAAERKNFLFSLRTAFAQEGPPASRLAMARTFQTAEAAASHIWENFLVPAQLESWLLARAAIPCILTADVDKVNRRRRHINE